MGKSMYQGELIVITGPMGSGKTDEAVNKIREFRRQNKQVQVFKPASDSRSDNCIHSHTGKSEEATTVKESRDILNYLDSLTDVVLIDEVQFLKDADLIETLQFLCISGITVYCCGLDLSSEGKSFGLMGELMAHADSVIKLHCACVDCGENARFTYYVGEKDAEVFVGDLDVYPPLCRLCYLAVSKEESTWT